MNVRAGDSHFHGPTGAVFTGDQASVHINMPCPGPQACPHVSPRGSPSAADENAFYDQTGIRAGPRVRYLLEKFHQGTGLRWRGTGGIYGMWKNSTLVYHDGEDRLKYNISTLNLWSGWLLFWFSVAMAVMAIFIVATSNGGRDISSSQLASTLAWFPISGFGCWFSIETMVAPEKAAKRLKGKFGDECPS